MLAADEKQTALQTIQAVVTAIAQNHYAAIPTLLSRSDLPMEELSGIQDDNGKNRRALCSF